MSSTVDAIAPMSVGPGFFRDDMPLDELQPSPLNPRKHFDQAGLEELAKSIREIGIIEPLVARPVGDHYELVAGERRYHSAKIAGLEVVPCTVKHLSDAQALEIMVIENNQREDVNALEEADGFSRLLKSGYELERLAERLGRSKKYVYDRIKLLDLVPAAKRLVTENRLTAGHAILIARLTPSQQQKVIDPGDGGAFEDDGGARDVVAAVAAGEKAQMQAYEPLKSVSVRELQKYIAQHFRFDVGRDALAAPLEYGETADRVAVAAAKPGRGKKVISITLEHFVQPEARDEHERTFGPQSFKFADGKSHRVNRWSGRTAIAPTCEFSVLGVVVVGEQYGQAFDVCIARDKCKVHWKTEMAERAKNQKLRDTGHTAKAERNEQASRDRRAGDQERRELDEKIGEEVGRRVLDRVIAGVTELTPDLLRLVLKELLGYDCVIDEFNRRFGTKWRWNGDVSLLKALSGRTLAQALIFAVADNIAAVDGLDSVAKAFHVDVRPIEATVRRELAPAPVQTSAQKKSAKKPAKKKR